MRSLLFVPADSERKIAKAMAATADGLILDLEDAVAPDSKGTARRLAAETLSRSERPHVGVRVNAIDTPWYLADLLAIAPAKPAFIMLPKCAGAADVARLAHQLDLLEAQAGIAAGSIGILPLVTESAAAVLRCDFAGASPRLIGLCFAAEDLSTDLGIAPRSPAGRYRAPMLLARATVLMAAAAAGVPAVDTPYPVPADLDGLRRESADALADGFAGKLCIHPGQIDIVNEVFSPSAAEIDWAHKIVTAFEAAHGSGVISLDGKMVDRPHLERAHRLLRRAAPLQAAE
ncbi:CoA ester lyase [Bosea sp. ASV33]|uniref:HpcH/HpaI aldolase/citrate lyase family protein n=1 Tax=Bosea sp. ASV33 TaxID=2795106 RepID=UPI0018EA34CE|nr:CoA ester lyase [Bosea sp. ASV33]